MSEIKKSKSNEPLSEFTEDEPTKQDRNQYMKDYYKNNKDTILKKAMVKQECKHCSRMVAYQQMEKHMKTKYCRSRLLDTVGRLNDIKEHFEEKGLPIENLEYIFKYMKK
jgi:hypothetical protein